MNTNTALQFSTFVEIDITSKINSIWAGCKSIIMLPVAISVVMKSRKYWILRTKSPFLDMKSGFWLGRGLISYEENCVFKIEKNIINKLLYLHHNGKNGP